MIDCLNISKKFPFFFCFFWFVYTSSSCLGYMIESSKIGSGANIFYFIFFFKEKKGKLIYIEKGIKK